MPADAAPGSWGSGVPVCVRPECVAYGPTVVGDATSGIYILWYDNRNSFDHPKLYLQRLTHNGTTASGWPSGGVRIGRELAHPTGFMLDLDGSGGVYITWAEFPANDIFLQRVGPDSRIAAGWPPNGVPVCVAPGRQRGPQTIVDHSGAAVVSWQDSRTGESDLYSLRVLPSGVRAPGWPENGLRICGASGTQEAIRAIADGQGGFFATWSDGRTEPWDLYVGRFNSQGTASLGWQPDGSLVRSGPYYDDPESLVPSPDGGVYVSWVEDPFDSSQEMDVYVQRLSPDGGASPGWPAQGVRVVGAPDAQSGSAMVRDAFGGVIMSWTDYRGSGSDVYVSRYLPTGDRAPGWPVDGKPVAGGPNFQFNRTLLADDEGGAFLVYESVPQSRQFVIRIKSDGSFAQGWPAEGEIVSPVGGHQQWPDATSDGTGGCVVVWEDGGPTTGGVYAQRFSDSPTSTVGSLLDVAATWNVVSLRWHYPGLRDGVVQRRQMTGSWEEIGQAVADASGLVLFDDDRAVAGTRYGYRVGPRGRADELFTAEAWVDVPRGPSLALHGSRPNPAIGYPRVVFSLPAQGHGSIQLLDLAGRALATESIRSLGPGNHVMDIARGQRLPAGVYWLRLTHDGKHLNQRVVIAH